MKRILNIFVRVIAGVVLLGLAAAPAMASSNNFHIQRHIQVEHKTNHCNEIRMEWMNMNKNMRDERRMEWRDCIVKHKIRKVVLRDENSNDGRSFVQASIHTTGPGSFNSVQAGLGGGSISNTGPHSVNVISDGRGDQHVAVTNNNSVHVNNSSNQMSSSGNATVSDNTFGGSASSGDARNQNNTNTNITASNQTPAVVGHVQGVSSNAEISNTGPHSVNEINVGRSASNERISNNNTVSVTNSNNQSARSGNATVSDNTFGGSASSGNARNNNDTRTSVHLNNE